MKYKKKTKKSDKSYPLFAIRLSEQGKTWLEGELTEAKERLNQGRDPESQYMISKGDILVEAVRLGLPRIKRG